VKQRTSKKPIVVPVDFSRHSEAAVLEACRLADCLRAPIIVLHVVHDPAEMPGYYAKVSKKLHKKKGLVRIEDAAKEMLEKFLSKVTKHNPDNNCLKKAETMLVVGLPVTRILQVVENTAAQMVVMGSEGRTGLKHVMLGSKAEQIVRRCPVPVTIVKSVPEYE
jgi:nucleotide-binding universal stress UspA family protein